MSKELEALKRVKYNSSKEVVDAFDVIENALKRLESIENTKPSEALELIDSIREYSHSLTMVNYLSMNSDLDTIKQALLKAQEQEKVLSIIKKKNVDVYLIKQARNLEEYNHWVSKRGRYYYQLTKEEFSLLKRWLDEKEN